MFNKLLFWGKEGENKRMIKLELFSKLPFLDIYFKINKHVHFGAWSSLLTHI